MEELSNKGGQAGSAADASVNASTGTDSIAKEPQRAIEGDSTEDASSAKLAATNDGKAQKDGQEEPAKEKKKRRRRRNYDDYDAEVEREEQERKKHRHTVTDSAATSLSTNATKSSAGSSSSDEDSEVDDEKLDRMTAKDATIDAAELAAIDVSNIITTGRRTRGKIIDYTKVAAAIPTREGGGEKPTVTSIAIVTTMMTMTTMPILRAERGAQTLGVE